MRSSAAGPSNNGSPRWPEAEGQSRGILMILSEDDQIVRYVAARPLSTTKTGLVRRHADSRRRDDQRHLARGPVANQRKEKRSICDFCLWPIDAIDSLAARSHKRKYPESTAIKAECRL